jgi:hypothetical protein
MALTVKVICLGMVLSEALPLGAVLDLVPDTPICFALARSPVGGSPTPRFHSFT